MRGLVIDPFAGPGGWSWAARQLGIEDVGIELDAAACATRAAAGLKTIRADVAAFPLDCLTREVWGLISSPPCTTFSAAGKRAGTEVTDVLEALILDMFEGSKTRAAHRREMARTLRLAWWPNGKMTRAERSAAIWKAVRSASLVAEPARFIHACRPEWVALEQVKEVLPLWQVYAAELRRMGYSAWTGLLNSADYGVPQTRIRAILIASRVREVARPEPTHYDARKGDQLWGDPWVSMAEALGWGATGRPGVSVTAGGTETGGAEPFGHRGREALEAERDAGRWALKAGNQPNAAVVPSSDQVPTMAFGHNSARHEWVLHRGRGATVHRRDDPGDEPAPTITAAGGKADGNLTWVVRTSFGQPSETSGTHEIEPCARDAHTVTGKTKDWAAWTAERPATTVQGDPILGRPGHKERDKGERQFEQDSVRITVQEAAILQSFPADYPWQGSKTAQFTQCGNAVPPLLAAHVLSMATGIPLTAADGQAA